ncbi:MAG: hypothetical protein JXC33_14265 [Deltaproteobacteria bacterium]|nr:hypothetical protein [Deltaproteobacteria bacterium]
MKTNLSDALIAEKQENRSGTNFENTELLTNNASTLDPIQKLLCFGITIFGNAHKDIIAPSPRKAENDWAGRK